MTVTLVRDQQAKWTTQKRELLGSYAGRFNIECDYSQLGQPLPGAWFEVQENGSFVGFAWLTDPEQDGTTEVEICLRDPARGVGTEVLKAIQEEARQLGCTAILGVVRADNEKSNRIAGWLHRHGFTAEFPPGWTVTGTFRAGLPLTLRKPL